MEADRDGDSRGIGPVPALESPIANPAFRRASERVVQSEVSDRIPKNPTIARRKWWGMSV
jgi:hypothetical protein